MLRIVMDVDRPVGQAIGIKEALDAIETGMCRIKESRDIWQNDLIYALCQGVRLLLTEEIKHGRQ